MAYNNSEYNVIDISGKDSSPKKYYCNHCRRSLFLRDKDTQEYICTFCTIIYYPNNELVKKANRFEVPDGSDPNQSRVPPIAMIDDVNKECIFNNIQTAETNSWLMKPYESKDFG